MNFKFYAIGKEYMDFLRSVDERIPKQDYTKNQYNSSTKQIETIKLYKPFIGIVFTTSTGINYCTQISSPKERHFDLPEDIDFKKYYLKDKNGDKQLTGVINFNYMFPVPTSELTEVTSQNLTDFRDFSNPQAASKYWYFLQKQLLEINKNNWERDIEKVYTGKVYRVAKRSLDFQKLELKHNEWIATKQSVTKLARHLSEQELLETNKKIRYDGADPNDLIDATFTVDKEEYKIKELELLRGKTKDMALLERTRDGVLFQDNDFASQSPLKLNLSPADKSNHLVTPHAAVSKTSSK